MRVIVLSIMVVAFSWSVPREALCQSKKKPAADKTERIEKLDTNGDGRIARDEVSETVWKRIAAHDTNSDGVLSGEELDSLKDKASETRRPGGATSAFEVCEFQASNKQTLRYSLFTPKNIAAGEKLPLVLCLHGAGGNTEAAKVLAAPEQQRKYPCFIVAPACETKQSRWVIGTFRNNPDQRAVEPELMEALDALLRDAAIDSDRVYLSVVTCPSPDRPCRDGVIPWPPIGFQPNQSSMISSTCSQSRVSCASKLSANEASAAQRSSCLSR